jgi:hypothetical protein
MCSRHAAVFLLSPSLSHTHTLSLTHTLSHTHTHTHTHTGFAQKSGSEFVFGVSFELPQACLEGSSYVWNRSNAESLLRYLELHKQTVWGFELGNEVNNNGGAPCNLTAEQQAAAMIVFAGMVQEAHPGAVLIGPDTGYKVPLLTYARPLSLGSWCVRTGTRVLPFTTTMTSRFQLTELASVALDLPSACN